MRKWFYYGTIYVPGAALLFYRSGGFWVAYWWNRWTLILGIFSIFFSIQVAKKVGWWILPVLLTSLLSSLLVSVSDSNPYLGRMELVPFLGLVKNALYGWIVVMSVAWTWAYAPARYTEAVRSFLVFVFWTSITFTLIQLPDPDQYHYGVTGNGGLNGGIIAALMPLVCQRTGLYGRLLAVGLGTLCIYQTHTSNAVGAFALMAALAFYFYRGSAYYFRFRAWPWIIGVFAAALGGGLLTQGDRLFYSSHRFQLYQQYLDWWQINADPWIGAGFGTSIDVLQQIQRNQGEHNFWLHSDWLQFFLETGLIGTFAMGIAVVGFLKRARPEPVLFIAAVTLMGLGLFDFPARVPVSWAVGVLVGYLVVNSRAESHPSK